MSITIDTSLRSKYKLKRPEAQPSPIHSSLSSPLDLIMGSRGRAPTPPSPPSPSVICCMCGDHGLPRELFRCKICLTRSQHKYCSDLYPKAEPYRACNWCLREEGTKTGAAAVDHNNNNSSTPSGDDSNSSIGGGSSAVKLHRGAFPSHLNKPVKKQRPPLERSSSEVFDRMRSEELSPGAGRGRPALRGKVRRYKLLEEVSS